MGLTDFEAPNIFVSEDFTMRPISTMQTVANEASLGTYLYFSISK